MDNEHINEKSKELIEMGYSEEYINIKNQLETSWPEWKISEYNDNFAVSVYAKKLTCTSSK